MLGRRENQPILSASTPSAPHRANLEEGQDVFLDAISRTRQKRGGIRAPETAESPRHGGRPGASRTIVLQQRSVILRASDPEGKSNRQPTHAGRVHPGHDEFSCNGSRRTFSKILTITQHDRRRSPVLTTAARTWSSAGLPLRGVVNADDQDPPWWQRGVDGVIHRAAGHAAARGIPELGRVRDRATKIGFFTEAIVPAVTHEDPRY